MEHLVTHAWVNGQWTAQTVSRERLMAQQKEYDDSVPTADQSPPAYGLLTRTLVRSPVVKQILPARIRSRERNDVVFVGETFVELHLLNDKGRLRRVGAKSDFRGNIRHAQVFATQKLGSGYTPPQPDSTQSQGVSMQLDGDDDRKQTLPPHLLVLTLDSGYLAFVYAKDSGVQRDVEFVVSMRRIGPGGSHLSHLGRAIAVDPKSRALAVAAWEGSFRMFALHSTDEMERQVLNGEPLNPVKEEKNFHVKGTILHVVYLYPPQEDQEHVILLLFLVDDKQKFRLQLYDWWCSRSLQTATRHGLHGLRLAEDTHFPLHVIPLVICSAFLIVTEYTTHVVKASDVVSGNATFAKISFPVTPVSGKRHGLVTAWARALRAPHYAYDHDDMYLALENGDIYFLEVESQGTNVVQTATKAAHLDCAPGTAFACLDDGSGFKSRGDLLITGGEGSDGGIYLLKHFVEVRLSAEPGSDTVFTPKLEQAVTNASPVIDFELLTLPFHGNDSGRAERDRVYTCTGRGEHGAVTEFRYGIEAQIQDTADYLQGVGRLFVLPDASGNGRFILSVLAEESHLLFQPYNGDDWGDASEGAALELSEVTLAAQALGSSTVQITPTTITMTDLRADEIMPTQDAADINMTSDTARPFLQHSCESGDTIIAAAFAQAMPTDDLAFWKACVVLAVRNGMTVRLRLCAISTDPLKNRITLIGQPTTMSGEPTFINVVELSGKTFAIVGTRYATVQLYEFDLRHGLLPGVEQSMNTYSPDAAMSSAELYVCQSAVLLANDINTKLLCGLRGGMVVIFEVTSDRRTLHLEKIREIRFGPIPVQLHSDSRSKHAAFVLAGPELYKFDMPHADIKASQVVFEESNSVSSRPADSSQSNSGSQFSQDGISNAIEPSVQALVQVDSFYTEENLVLCATNDRLFFADIGDGEKVCTRRLRLGETPKRLLYYEPLRVFIVACSKVRFEENFANASGTGKKQSFCSLRFIDPRTGESRADKELKDSSKNDKIFARANEHIHCISEWTTRLDGKVYRYIVVGTGYINLTSSGHKKGRLVVLSASENLSSGRIDVRRRFQIQCDAPVYSVCPYGDSSLIYCSGKMLYLKTLDPETKKLDATAEKKLRSEGIRISVSLPHIFVTRAKDSLLSLKYENGQLYDLYSDVAARAGFDHIQLLDDFFLVTDKGKGAVGLWLPPGRRNTESLSVVFESNFTSSICRLRQGRCRPPWNSNRPRPGIITLERNLLAASTSGAFYQLTLLTCAALRVLRLVQDLFEGKKDSRSYSILDFSDDDDECADLVPVERHVDGDKLACAVKLGSEWLRHAVENRLAVRGDASVFMSRVQELLNLPEGTTVFEALMQYINDLVEDAIL